MNRSQFDAKVRSSQHKMTRAEYPGNWTEEDSRLAAVGNVVAYLDQLSAAQVKAEAKEKGLKPADSSKFAAQYAIGEWVYDRQVRRDAGEDLPI